MRFCMVECSTFSLDLNALSFCVDGNNHDVPNFVEIDRGKKLTSSYCVDRTRFVLPVNLQVTFSPPLLPPPQAENMTATSVRTPTAKNFLVIFILVLDLINNRFILSVYR
jgi:hypothetical protein